MVALTPDALGTSLIVTYAAIIFSTIITVYTVYLNIKQAKVSNQMGALLEEVRALHQTIKNYGV